MQMILQKIPWDTVRAVFEYVGYAATLVVVTTFIVGIVLTARGLVPALIRLGRGLAKRKIAVLASGDALTSLVTLLDDSKLFKAKNILRVPSGGDLDVVEEASVLLLYWPHWKDQIGEILAKKRDGDALVVYAPQEEGFIPKDIMALLSKKRNVVVNNFRGRLLNDIVTSMITTRQR